MGERLNLSSRAIVGDFYAALEDAFKKAWVSRLGWLNDKSNQNAEEYKWLGQVPGLREWIGERIAKGLLDHGFTITNKHYEATLEIARADLRRDKTGQIGIRVGDFAGRAAAHWNKLVSDLILNGETGLCYDGLYFFDQTHEEGDSGSQYNLLTNSEVAALDVTTATAPTEAEMALAILGVIGYMSNYKDDQGEPMNENAEDWLVMTPFNLHGAALAVVSERLLDTGSGGRGNVVRKAYNIEAVMNPRLASAASAVFYLFRTDARAKAFILQEETGIQVSVLGEGSDHAFKNNSHLVGVETNRAAGYGLWQYAAKCTLS